ncbi:MAG: nicotinic acid mononucleotide adenylyltransferase [Clostridiales bacterium]|jgi:nicotinate-nucleotide adenylyltransferase|nr:nicotinic acid mononucleotide adenylyltransferase [Clostridiales bacterium]
MQKSKRVGISGGTFDPIHYGHLITAEHIREKFELDKILFIPAGTPPHKDINQVTESEHRYNMVCSAVNGNPAFEVSRVEVDRKGYTYTVDTLSQLQQSYGRETEFNFIIGADVVSELLTWKDPERVFGLCNFIAVFRPGYEMKQFLEQIEYLKKSYSARIKTINVPLIDISSTEIRSRVKSGLSIRYLVPHEVEQYIYKNKLYHGGL